MSTSQKVLLSSAMVQTLGLDQTLLFRGGKDILSDSGFEKYSLQLGFLLKLPVNQLFLGPNNRLDRSSQ